MKTDHLPNIDSTAFVGMHLRITPIKKAARRPTKALKTQSQSKSHAIASYVAFRVSDRDIDRLQRLDTSRARS